MRTTTFDLILRDGENLDDLVIDEREQFGLIQRLLALSVVATGFYGLVVATSIHTLGAANAFWFPVALVGAFLGTLALCLPSFWFYTQLAGVDASFGLVTAQALRVQAKTSVLLLGVLPIYAIAALASSLGTFFSPGVIYGVGLFLPFAVGLAGISALHESFKSLAPRLLSAHERRGRFLLRMILAWGAVYSFVAPVALYKLIAQFGVAL